MTQLNNKSNISANISYREATHSLTAKRERIDNTPSESQLANMKVLAEKIFEQIRTHFGRPINIASFFRCKSLNQVVGGADNSQHMAIKGAAMDIDNDNNNQVGPTNKEIFDYVKDNLEFDQLIYEYGDDKNPDWVHVSYNEGKNRKQVLRCKKRGQYIKYQ